ncbi:hypothetical protein ZRA01_00570 [Zoogloea ramigera]|uniref:Uncharacterized protein n=1 Tax=Zoogloea ramigera TaxID=350 RepID=A0A4Y4CRA2_ZOORA|nr:hypothetical protein ZRA01_00570 [Zoogloea ramigera]
MLMASASVGRSGLPVKAACGRERRRHGILTRRLDGGRANKRGYAQLRRAPRCLSKINEAAGGEAPMH